ncbi:urease subunit alpha [Enterococcus ureilyticus]|uniref:Urease subunit alpha n=3 Tax=Enterococcus TaxID=1350 RepID=A0A1E5H9V9_9ENTE|nr:MULTISPECIES: urease subunit alpha [Enterococcus]ALS36169.1 urease subunit alpha [Enterococcus rotai]MBM7687609.1 urease subunit alpha [Enterococcus ureilyticus]MBO0421941.1 urease subunit alpha [Enterococcus plantarum]MBO0445244.1 urease subunit alpha [Enterococcus ureilyticus]OEG17390.1 urease subunit alpha [Enterococcus plantarum]
MSFKMDRSKYAQMFGPIVGDSVRLGDTDLFAAIEKDYTIHGEESKFGGGKVLRDGMGQSATETRAANPLVVDTIITNATIIDYTGIIKADIGIRDGKIIAIGKGGNPDNMDDIDFVVGASTEAISAEGLIVTAGGLDIHVHFISPGLAQAGLDNGITTLFGGGTGPADGTNSATTSPGKWHIERMLQSAENLPINIGVMAKGAGAVPETIAEQIEAGAMAIKNHEDWGATAAGIDNSLKAADQYDVQFAVHTDSLNEGGFVQNTLDAFQGRTVHTFHTEGAGGGHAPDIMVVAGHDNVLPSSTNPTNPYTINEISELFDMVMVCHNLDPKLPEDVSFAESRVRKQTIAAEDVLHDMGALSIMTSDAMAMGRVGEVAMRCWQLADKMKKQRGPLDGDSEFNDNNRIKRYIAKYTINPAITNGVSDYIGSVEVGKYADLVIWEPAKFGAKPKMVLKMGMISYGVMGDASSSLPTPQPRLMRDLFGACGKAVTATNITFVSQFAYDHGIKENIGLEKVVLPVHNTRNLTKRDMKLNNFSPKTITVDPHTFDVKIDDELITCDPVDTVALSQRYYLF